MEIFLKVLFDLDGSARDKEQCASSLAEVQALSQHIFINECL